MKEEIVKLHKDGLSNREIAIKFSLHHKTVAKYLSEYNLKSTGYKNGVTKNDSSCSYKCTKCFEVKEREMFSTGRIKKKDEYRFLYCKECRKKQIYLNLNSDVNKYLSDRYNRLILRCKTKSIDCNFTKEEFIELYKKQKGKCFYTDEKMNCKVSKGLIPTSLSLDRIIPENGYVKGNVVMCCNRINSVKNNLTLEELKKWIPKWHKRIKKRK